MKLPIHTDLKSIFWLSTTTWLVLATLTTGAVAAGREPLRGPHPWDFSERKRETSLALQYAHDNRNRGVSGYAGYGSTVVINNTTMAVGNWQQIEMTLGDGAEGLIMTENHQDNSGNSAAGSSVMDNAIDVAENGGQRSNDRQGGKADGLKARDRGGRRDPNDRKEGKSSDRSASERHHRSRTAGHGEKEQGDNGSEGGSSQGKRARTASERSKSTESRDDSSQRPRQNHDQPDRHRSVGKRHADSSLSLRDRDLSRLKNDDVNEQTYQPCGRKGYLCWGGIE